MPKIVTVTMMKKDSQRLPGKNARVLGGQPLYRWTVDTAKLLAFPYVLFHNYEPPILWMEDKAQEIVYTGDGIDRQHERLLELDADIYVLLSPTSPFRDAALYRQTILDFAADTWARVLVSLTPCRPGRYYDGCRQPVNFEQGQKTTPLYRESGALFIFRRVQLGERYFLDCDPEDRRTFLDPVGIDIDTEEDWQAAEAYLKKGGRA